MGSEYEEFIWICGRRYNAFSADLEKPAARRTSEMLIRGGFITRIRKYHPLETQEPRYVVYAGRPRGMSPSQPISVSIVA